MKKIFLSLLLILGVTGCVFSKDEPVEEEPKKEVEILLVDDLSFEIFSDVTIKDLISEDNEAEILNEEDEVDTSKLGELKVSIQYKDRKKEKEHDVRIKIVDTESPKIEYTKELSTTVGTSINLTKGVTVTDNSKEDISVSVSGDYDFNKAGTYKLKYIAFDSSNNKTEEEFTLVVKEEEKKTSTSSSSSSTKTNSGSTNKNTGSTNKNTNSNNKSRSNSNTSKFKVGTINGVGKSYFRGYSTYTSDMSKWRYYDECTLDSFTFTPVIYKDIDSRDSLKLEYKVKWTRKDGYGDSGGCWANIKITDEGGNVLSASVEMFGKKGIIYDVGDSSTYTGSIAINTKLDLIEGTKINVSFSEVSKKNLKG